MANDPQAAAGIYKQTLLAGLWRDSWLTRLLLQDENGNWKIYCF